MPLVALAPLLVVYLGFGLAPKLVIIALVCFFPITVGAVDGFEAVDPEYRRMMRTLHATPTGDLPPGRVPGGAAVDLLRRAGGRLLHRHRRALRRVRRLLAGLGFTIREANDQFDTALIGAAVLLLARARADPLLGGRTGAAGGRALVAPGHGKLTGNRLPGSPDRG